MNNNGETMSFGRVRDVLQAPPFSDSIEPDSFRYNGRIFSDDNPIFKIAVADAVLSAVGEDDRSEALDALVREEVLSLEEATEYGTAIDC